MLEIIAEYGMNVVPWVLALLGSILARYIWVRIENEWAQGVAQRAYAEIVDATLEVWQTYVSALKEGAADGKLTEEEARSAKTQALAIVKSNLGAKGLKRLARALGFSELGGVIANTEMVDGWIENKAETAVATMKAAGLMGKGAAAPNPT